MPKAPLYCEPLEPRSLLAVGAVPPLPVVVADLNGDGLRDVAIVRPDVSSGTSVVQVYRGAADGSFSAPTSVRLGMVGVSLEAVQGDKGTLLAVNGPSSGGAAARTLLQVGAEGDLSAVDEALLGMAQRPSAPWGPWHAAPVSGDLTGDGVADLATLDEQGRILVRIGLPGGRFLLPQLMGGGLLAAELTMVHSAGGTRLAALGVEGDTPSVMLFSYDDNSESFVMTNGPALPVGTMDLVSGDFTGNGLDDLAASGADGLVRIWLQRPDGSFASDADRVVDVGAPAVLSVKGRQLIAASLLNGQTFPVEGPVPTGPPSLGLPMYVAQNDGVMAEGDLADGAVRIMVGGTEQDLNVGAVGGVVLGPGWMAALDRDSGTVLSFVRSEDGSYRLQGSYAVGAGARGLSSTVEENGQTDLLVGLRSGDVVRLEGLGDGKFRYAGRASAEVSLVVADLNGDGVDDFIYSNRTLDRIYVETSGGQVSEFGQDGDVLAGGALLADLNGDGILDLAVCNEAAGSVLIYPGLGGGKFGAEINGGKGISVPDGPVALATLDMGEKGVGLVVVSEGADRVTVLGGDGDGWSWPTETMSSLPVGLRPASVLVQDVTGDGLEDLVVACSGSDSIWIVPGLGDGQFDLSRTRVLATGHNPTRVVTGDFNGDGRLDLVSVDSGSYGLTYYSDVASAGTVARQIWTGEAPVAALARDVNNDGISDLIVSTFADNHVSLLIGGVDGPSLQQSLAAPGMSSLSLAASSIAPEAFWVMDEKGGEAWLLKFGLEVPSGGDVPREPKGGEFDLVPLERGAVPLVPLWRGEAGPATQAPLAGVLTSLAALFPADVWPHGYGPEGLSGRCGAGCKELPTDEARLGPMPPGPPAVDAFLLGAEAAGPPPLPPEVKETVMPLDRVPASGGHETVSAKGQGEAVQASEDDEQRAQSEGPKGDDLMTRSLLALSLGGAVWLGTRQHQSGVPSTR
jgi:hypothetical protein